MRIGIMGGTFDPIHNGHLALGQSAYEQFDLDEIWFMPNGNPPHKDQSSIKMDATIRSHMVELAIADKEAYEKQYQVFCKLLKASRKEVPLSEIIDCIERIVVDVDRKIMVKWTE